MLRDKACGGRYAWWSCGEKVIVDCMHGYEDPNIQESEDSRKRATEDSVNFELWFQYTWSHSHFIIPFIMYCHPSIHFYSYLHTTS